MTRCGAADRCPEADHGGRHWLVATAVLLVHAVLLAYSGYVHSPTLNEPAHLAAGISHWQFGRFELYRVNPPLVRMIAALPVLVAGAKTDWSAFYEGPGARPIYGIDDDFVAANGHRTCWLVTLGRWACIPLSLVGGVVCFLWGRALYGGGAGLAALVLWCFSPNILAHGALITPDLAAAALGLAAAYLFWRWLKEPCWSCALGAGLALGLAELTKTTWIVLFPLWPALWLFWRGAVGRKGTGTFFGLRAMACGKYETGRKMSLSPTASSWPRQAVQLAAILCLGVYVLNLGYGFEGSMTRLGDYQFVSRALAAGAEPREENGRPHHQRPGNRFAGTFLAAVRVPLPKNYVVGIDVQRRDFDRYSWPSYLRGTFRDRGWWYYYLYGLAIKVPLGTWLLVFGVAVLRLARPVAPLHTPEGNNPREAHAEAQKTCERPNESHAEAQSYGERGRVSEQLPGGFVPGTSRRCADSSEALASELVPSALSAPLREFSSPGCEPSGPAPPRRMADEVVLLAPAAVVLVLVSSQTGFNHHLRYVLPALPFLFVWASQVATVAMKNRVKPAGAPRPRCVGARIFSSCRFHASSLLFGAALLWSVTSSLQVYPHSLSYFNELAGGPTGGHAHLIHSNIDWGQDLLYLKRWLDGHPEARPLRAAYFGTVHPHHLGIEYRLPPVADPGAAVPQLEPGWYAVSVNFLRGFPYHMYDEKGDRQSLPMGALSYFQKLRPAAMAGYSIYIYCQPATPRSATKESKLTQCLPAGRQ
ncbi:MAG: hypothetical protein A2W31_13165, partial [Planctomycetes bacterium RBG_16_64_10]